MLILRTRPNSTDGTTVIVGVI